MLLKIELPAFMEVVRSGPGGLLVAAIFFAVFLIIIEQRRDNPRKSIIRIIIGILGISFLFAITLIFMNSFENNDKYTKLVTQLKSLSIEQGPFAESFMVDKNGDPKDPTIKINDTDSIKLAGTLSLRTLRNKERTFDIYGDSILYIKTDNGTYLGYVNLKNLENNFHLKDTKIKPEDLLYASLKRGSIPEYVVKSDLLPNVKQAAKYLIKIIKDKGEEVSDIKTNAGKGLVHYELLNILEENQFEELIKYLKSGKRKLPFRHFELAQVYTVLNSQELLFDTETSSYKRDSCYEKYISWWNSPSNRQYYESRPKTYAVLASWDSLAHIYLGKEIVE